LITATMASETSNLDGTFRNFTPEQAAAYSRHRADPYSQKLYDVVLEYHKSHGGQFDSLLDVGCGTGEVARSLAFYYDSAIGIDPGSEMIAQAKLGGGITRSGKMVDFEVRGAEDLADLPKASVDLLVAGMAVSDVKPNLICILTHGYRLIGSKWMNSGPGPPRS
jgi:trans-aconitate 3-methyltransferase